MWHPNVDTAGNICLDILKDAWSAALSVSTVLLSLQSLLAEPNPASPLNSQAASQWANPAEYRRIVLKKYAEAGGVLAVASGGGAGAVGGAAAGAAGGSAAGAAGGSAAGASAARASS